MGSVRAKSSYLSDEQIRFYHENGYLHVPGVLRGEQLDEFRREIDWMVAKRAPGLGWQGNWRESLLDPETRQATELVSIHDVQFYSATFSRLLVDDRITGIIAALIGPNVQLHHTKMLVKPPERGTPFPMHQDFPFFPHEGTSCVAMTLHADDTREENGCLCVFPGSQKLGPLEHIHQGSFFLDPREWPIEKAVAVPVAAGDAVIFSYLTVHGSYLNVSDRPRRNVLIQFRAPNDKPTAQVHLSRGQGMMLRGVNEEIDPNR